MVNKFIRSLKGNAFDQYTDLKAGTINTWEQLEQEFLNQFYSTRHVLSMRSHKHSLMAEEPMIDLLTSIEAF